MNSDDPSSPLVPEITEQTAISSDTTADKLDVHKEVSEEAIISLTTVVEQYRDVTSSAVNEFRREKYWRRISLIGGLISMVFFVIVGIILISNSVKVDRTTRSTNNLSRSSNVIAKDVNKTLDILQRQQADLAIRQAAAAKIIEEVLRTISDNNQKQLDSLRQDLQNFIRQLQQGTPVSMSIDDASFTSASYSSP